MFQEIPIDYAFNIGKLEEAQVRTQIK